MADTVTSPSTITVALLLAALGIKITDLIKYALSIITGDDDDKTTGINGLLSLLLSAVVGFAVVQWLLKPSAWGDEILIGKEKLADLPFGSTLVFGVVFSALASTLYDFKKAVDNNGAAQTPRLVGDRPVPLR